MKYLIIIFFGLGCNPTLSFATDDGGKVEGTVKSFGDYVKIRHMPSREDFYKKEPVTELKGESQTIIVISNGTVMGTNGSIKQIYEWARRLSDLGITSNQRQFHVSTKKIEVSYMGKKISLEYAGASNSEKYSQYEKEWRSLYNFAYQYLIKDMAL